MDPADDALERSILALRAGHVAEAAARLVAAGEVEVTQRGAVVDPLTARRPVRILRVR